MIPKIIHYCWFGLNPKPRMAQKCIKSWKKYCPDYQIVEWNEENFDITTAPLFVRQAYEAKKWAFVSDYVRLWAVYHHGGIYFDLDMRLLRNADALLENPAFFALEGSGRIATGLGFGAEKNAPILLELMHSYEEHPFLNADGTPDETVCSFRDTPVLTLHGMQPSEEIQKYDGFTVYPTEYFCVSLWRPKTDNTYVISYYSGSWRSAEEQKRGRRALRNQKIKYYLDIIVHVPNRLIRRILGEQKYEKMKTLFHR